MADTDTETDTAPPPSAAPAAAMSPEEYQKIIQGLLGSSNTPVAKAAPVDTESNAPTSWAGILGEHLAGGPPDVVDLTKEQRESAGRRALLSFGAGMMSVGPFDTLGQGLASGIRGAQASQYTSEGLEAQRQVSAQDRQQQGIVNQINAATAAGPLMTVQLALARLKAMQGLPNPLAGGTPGTTPGTQIGGNSYEGAIAAHEGTGADPRSNAVAGFLPSTWGDFVKANPTLFAGMTPAQALAARSNPALVTQATTWLAQQNAKTLAGNGVTPSGQSLGIAHYLGAGGATKVLGAPDSDPVSKYVSNAAVEANPELATMTVGQMKQRYASMPAPAFLGGPAPGKGTQFAGPGVPLQPAGGQQAPALPVPPIPPPPDTTTAPGTPAPQATTMATPPPDASVPDDKLNFEQFRQRHPIQPSADELAKIIVTEPADAKANRDAEVADARKAQADAAQRKQLGLSTGQLDPKATSDFNAATERETAANQNYNQLVQEAAKATATNMRSFQDKQLDTQRQLFNDARSQAQTVAEKEKDRAAAVALKTQEGQQAIELAHITAGTTLEQQQQKGEMDAGNKTLAEMGTQAVKADAIQPMLRQLIPLLKNPNAPSGVVGQFLTSHSDWLPMLQEMGVDPQTATVTSLVKGLTDFMSLDLKPTATGALRNQEIPMLKGLMPDLATSKPTQQQALARILNYTQRVKDEYDLASENFGNKDASGRPNYKILYKNIDAPMELDQNGRRVGGGLGAAVPEPPPMPADPRTATPGQTEAARRYNKYVSALPSGMPYNIYERQTDGSYQRVLKVRD
jgi:hypothetical protein